MRLSVVSSLRLQEWNVRIKGLLSNGQWQEALSCYVSMTRSGSTLTDYTLFPAIMKASSQLSFKQGHAMHGCSVKRGYDCFISVGNSVMDFYMKWGIPTSAFSVFSSMSNRDSISWNIIIHGYLELGDLEAGIRFFSQGRVSGFEPNVSTLVLVAQALRSLRDFVGGRRFHGYLMKSGILGVLSLQNSLLGMYSDGDLGSACQVFDEMCGKDVISWSMMIGACVQNEESLIALRMFKDMRVEPDGLIFVSVLKACGNVGDANLGRLLHKLIISSGHNSDVFVGNSLIDMYSRCGDPTSSLRVFREMGIKNVVSWNSVLSGLIHNGMHHEALSLAKSMVQEDVETDEVSLVNFLQLCKHFSEPAWCKAIHSRVIRHSYESNPLVISSLIDAYAKCNLIELAWKLFSRTEKQDVVLLATMIGGFAHCGMPDEAVSVFQKMNKTGEKINSVVILNLIEACSVSAELRKAKWAHGIAIRHGFADQVSVGTAILDMYSKCGAVGEADKVFNLMPEKNIMSWSSMISAYGMNGHSQDALTLLTDMKQHGLKPNAVTALSVLAACSHGGLIQAGLAFFREMIHDLGIQPSLEHYACVIDMLGRSGNLEYAMDLIKMMPETYRDGASLWGAVLSASTRYKNSEIGEKAASAVLELEPFGSSGYLLGSSLHARRGSWVDAAKMRRLLKERKVRVVAGYSLVHVNDQAYKFVAGDNCKPQSLECWSIVEQLHKCMQVDQKYDEDFVRAED